MYFIFGGPSGEESACQCRRCKNHGFDPTQILSLGREDPLEEGMATHSSILAWRIPWTEEPGGLQSVGPQRAGHDIATEHRHQFFLEGWFVLHLPQGLQGPTGLNERKLLASLATPGGRGPGGESPSVCWGKGQTPMLAWRILLPTKD